MTEPLPHIAFICSRLDLPGGIERAIVNTANMFHRQGHPVTLVITDNTANSFYTIDPGVNIKQADLNFGITTSGNVFSRKLLFMKHVRALRSIFQATGASIFIGTEPSLTIATWLA